MATVLIPTPLRRFTGNLSKINIQGMVIAEIIENMILQYPEMQKYLLDPCGSLRPFINIFIDQDDIRSLQAQQTAVGQNSIISIVPAIAGGNYAPALNDTSRDSDKQKYSASNPCQMK